MPHFAAPCAAPQLTSLRKFASHGPTCRRHPNARPVFSTCSLAGKQKDQFRRQQTQAEVPRTQFQLTRRDAAMSLLLALQLPALLSSDPAQALGFQKEVKKKPSIESYSTSESGLKYFDLEVGGGNTVKDGDVVSVHFDCLYKKIDVVSSRSARLLGANRSIAEPVEFTAGQAVGSGGVKVSEGDSAGGLFSGASGPKPPPALSQAVIGMKAGGKRSVIVPPELGYGKQGLQEIPPNATIELQVQVLSVKA